MEREMFSKSHQERKGRQTREDVKQSLVLAAESQRDQKGHPDAQVAENPQVGDIRAGPRPQAPPRGGRLLDRARALALRRGARRRRDGEE